MHLSEILNHLGENRETYFNAVSPPVIQSSNFVFKDLDKFRTAISNEIGSHLYTRGNNPTVAILREKLAALEGAQDALVFGSGVAAVAAAVIGNVGAGDHIVCVKNPYSWTFKLLDKFLRRFGVTFDFVDGTETSAIEAAIKPETKVLMLESPNSLTFELQDLEACAALAKKHNLVSIIDNSYCSPLFQQPIKLGIDITVHSGTKYLNGHSDVVCGVLCGSREMVKKIFDSEQMNLGSIISPHDAMLIIRGLRTFELRMKRSNESAAKIASWLEAHPKVDKVNYPFSKSFPQYDLARKQMTGTGGLFSVVLKTKDPEKLEAFFYALKRFLLAVSWGGHESLVLPVVALYNIPGKENPDLPINLFRFYIGLEDPDWLIEDLKQAFDTI